MKQIGIVILNYQTHVDTKELVAALQKQTVASDLFIVVVDNASPNGSFDQLKPLEQQYTNVVVLQSGTNLGYAKGNNFGLYYLDKHVKPKYVAILNNDIILKNNILEVLAQCYEELYEPAIISPVQISSAGKELPPYRINSFLDDCLNLFYIFKLFHKRNALKFTDNTGQQAMKLEMIPGSFMFASFERFKAMGFFYSNTFLFVEERFIAVAARQKGWNNYIILNETYVHAHSKTINAAMSPVKKYKYLYDGWLEFTRVCRKHGKLKAALLKPLIRLSLLELKIVFSIRKIVKG